MSSTLELRNVVVHGHRTSMRLERVMWEALEEIAEKECVPVPKIVGKLDHARTESSLTAAVRVFCVQYFRTDGEYRRNLIRGIWDVE